MPRLEYDPNRGSFRGWLFTVVRNKLRDWFAASRRQPAATGDSAVLERLEQQPAPSEDWEADYQRQLFAVAVEHVRRDFQESTWQAFWLTAVHGKSGKEVAGILGMTTAAVYLAKRRVVQLPQGADRVFADGVRRRRPCVHQPAPTPPGGATCSKAAAPTATSAGRALDLEGCRRCQQTLEQADGLRRVMGRGRAAAARAARALAQTMERLKASPAEAGADTAGLDTVPGAAVAFLRPSCDPLHLGRLGPYEVLEVIGRGGMGVVLRAST